MLRCSLLAFLLAFPTHSVLAQEAAPARSAALNTLLHDIWEDRLKRSPVFASSIGDMRYNDQLPDLSPRAVNDRLAAQHGFLIRLLSIDISGLPDQQRLAADRMQRELVQDEEAARYKEWELPLTDSHGISTDLPGMVENLRFATIKDFDDYIARLHLIPRQLRQASENLLAGIDDQRVQTAAILEKALKQTQELAGQRAADSSFARPLQQFPAAIDAPTRKRISTAMLDAIETDVLPAYVRFAKFLRVTELPAASTSTTAPTSHALSYTVDEAKILELRDRAKSTLGQRFDLKAFHDLVAANEELPAEILEERINAWIAAKK